MPFDLIERGRARKLPFAYLYLGGWSRVWRGWIGYSEMGRAGATSTPIPCGRVALQSGQASS